MFVRSTILVLLLATAMSKVTFEDLDPDKLIGNEEQRKAAFACLMDQKPCGEYQELRDKIPHMAQTKCAQCNPKQKKKYEELSNILLEKYPDLFNALANKYLTTH